MRFNWFVGLLPVLLAGALQAETPVKERWLQKSGYGLMFHYEAFKEHSPQSYNRAIESFEVDRFVGEVESTGAGRIIFVVGQHWGRYCAPNSAYEKLLGVGNGVWTSKRDLILEIGEQLAERDIRLIIYMTARAPMRHYQVIKAMGDALPSINGKPADPGVDPMTNGRKVKGTIHWVSAEHCLPAEVRLYDHLFSVPDPSDIPDGGDYRDNLNPESLVTLTDCRVEQSLQSVQPGDRYQFERNGYFCVDVDSTPSKLVFNRTVTLRDAWAKLQKKGAQK
jgi:hypothetical protein